MQTNFDTEGTIKTDPLSCHTVEYEPTAPNDIIGRQYTINIDQTWPQMICAAVFY